jgi:hypothetical protein
MICVLGFDSASVPVLERMLAAGDLPNLAATIDRGRRLELRTPATDFAAGAFYSLYSGVELADHGIFYPFQWSAGEQRARYVTAFEAPAPVWERLADAGLRTLAIDPYESRPPSRANGVFVCGWGFSDRVVLPRWSYPAGIGRRLERSFGRGPRATEVFGTPTPAQLLRLREKLLAAPARIAALARELLARVLRSHLADVQRRPPRRARVLGSLAARPRGPRRGDEPPARRHARGDLRRGRPRAGVGAGGDRPRGRRDRHLGRRDGRQREPR